MKKCFEICKSKEVLCDKKECRLWINFEEDLNCTVIAVDKNGEMTLRETAERLGISFVRVKQIQDLALKKLIKKDFTNN